MLRLADWFLTAAERGNPSSKLPAWCEGNRAQPLIHGAAYFDQLVTEVEALQAGDHLFFTDWRGDPDEKMRGTDLEASRLPEQPSEPPPCRPHAVQVLRTYPNVHFAYDFAPRGERSLARAYNKVVPRARQIVYVEDQTVVEAGRHAVRPSAS